MRRPVDRRAYMRDYYDQYDRAARGWRPRQPIAPVFAHIETCRAAGMSYLSIAQQAGVAESTIRRIALGRAASIREALGRKILAVRPDRPVTAVGMIRRMRALARLGWTAIQVAEAAGVDRDTVKSYRRGEYTSEVHNAAQRLVRAYDELSMRLPSTTSRYERTAASRVRNHAQRHHWSPPLAWDDDTIDDPSARPAADAPEDDQLDEVAILRAMRGDDVRLTRAERQEAVARLAAMGMPDATIAGLLRRTERTIFRDRQERGIESRWTA